MIAFQNCIIILLVVRKCYVHLVCITTLPPPPQHHILTNIFSVLPTILPLTLGLDLNTRHGSILCAAEVTHALYSYGVENNRFVHYNIFLILSVFRSIRSIKILKWLSCWNSVERQFKTHKVLLSSCSYCMAFGSFRSLLDILGTSCVQELENIIPKVRKQSISSNAFVLSFYQFVSTCTSSHNSYF